MKRIKHVGIFGPGGVGGYFGAKILEAVKTKENASVRVSLIARGQHLKAIQKDGLKLITPDETITVVPDLATDNIQQVPTPDLWLLCVKSYDLKKAIQAIEPKIEKSSFLLPLLNGMGIYDRIRKVLKLGIVMPACVYVGTHIQSPGIIQQSGGDGKILFGNDPIAPEESIQPVKSFFRELRIDFEWSHNAESAIWEKYIFIAAFGLVTAFTGRTIGEVLSDRKSLNIVHSVMSEILDIAENKSIRLPKNIIEASMAKAKCFPFDTKTSYQRDLEQRGHFNEGNIFGETIIEFGRIYGVPTPATEDIYLKIKQREELIKNGTNHR